MRLLLALCVGSLIWGCTREIKVETPFNVAEAQFINVKGKGQIEGQAFLRRNDGVVVYAAGSDVHLIPNTPYAEERLGLIYDGAQVKQISTTQARLIKIPDEEPQYIALRRITKANGEGRFVFTEVSPGPYFVTTTVQWCAPSQYGCVPQGGALRERVRITGAEKASVIMNGQ